jgi:hypothetical protein
MRRRRFLRPNCKVMRWGNDANRSFAAAWCAGDVEVPVDAYGHTQLGLSRAMVAHGHKRDWRQHDGYAWGTRRAAWNGIGGLPDWLITGSRPIFIQLWRSWEIGEVEAYLSPGATRRLGEFARRCDEHIRQDIGVVPGTLIYDFMAARKRNYLTRKDDSPKREGGVRYAAANSSVTCHIL